uniref:Uncharacterized protein n=1 Tax=Oncorhynchus mykiss TaxID=8022 RepID=A0A8K9WYS5_ONCMY
MTRYPRHRMREKRATEKKECDRHTETGRYKHSICGTSQIHFARHTQTQPNTNKPQMKTLWRDKHKCTLSVQADLRSTLGDAGYIVFGVILFVWELLPTSLVVFFFRVRRLPQDRSGSGIRNHVLSSRGYFFDNPRRYDSDDDLAWSIPPQNNSTSLITDCYDWGSHNSSFTGQTGTDEQRLAPVMGELRPY